MTDADAAIAQFPVVGGRPNPPALWHLGGALSLTIVHPDPPLFDFTVRRLQCQLNLQYTSIRTSAKGAILFSVLVPYLPSARGLLLILPSVTGYASHAVYACPRSTPLLNPPGSYFSAIPSLSGHSTSTAANHHVRLFASLSTARDPAWWLPPAHSTPWLRHF